MRGMFNVGLRGGETEHATRIGGFVCETNFGEPIEDTIESYAIHSRQRIFAQLFLDIAMAEWLLCQLKQAENPNTRCRYTRSRRADDGLDS